MLMRSRFGVFTHSLIVSFPCCRVRLAAGMNMSPVSRLKKTWSKVKTAKFDILEVSLTNSHKQFDPLLEFFMGIYRVSLTFPACPLTLAALWCYCD